MVATKRHAFTLIELLVVISIISLLVAILLPALKTARTSAQMAGSLSNIRQITIAHMAYAADSRGSLIFLTYNVGTSTHQRPNWAGELLEQQYVNTIKIFWGPGRNTSELNLNNPQFTSGDPWYYTGYGANPFVLAKQRDNQDPTFIAATSSNPKFSLNLGLPNTPPPGHMLLMAEPSTDVVGGPKASMPGAYYALASTAASTSTNLFSYNGAAVHAYCDGHGSGDARSVGWTATNQIYGKWIYVSTNDRKVAPWYYKWWQN